MIVDEDVARVREASDIVAVVSQYTQLKRVGRRFMGLCPFHSEKTGSFSVNGELNLYHCFGCSASGDVITFVREQEHLDFVGAVEHLAHKAGITLRYTEKAEGEGRRKRKELVELLTRAVDWYHERLLTADDAGRARGYLRSRGIDGETARAYKLGWAPDDWDQLARHLRVSDAQLKASGLGFVNRRQRQQDFFRGRVLFPIYDAQGDPVSFGARILPGGEGGKYINLPETAVYNKSKTLYGLNWAKAEIVNHGAAIVCEGYTDVIGFARAGIPRAVATCGTALTEEHIRALKRFAPRVILAFDADAAGQAAAERFYEWERAYEIDVAVADLPPGVDPADLASSDPAELARAVDEAIPFLGFRVTRALGAGDLTTPEGRGRTAEAAVDVIRAHPSELVRDQYLMDVAARCRIDVDRLRAMVRNPPRRPAAPVASAATPAPAVLAREDNSVERDALRVAVADVERATKFFDEVLFGRPEYATVFHALVTAGSVHGAIEAADPLTADLLRRLAQEESDATAEEAFVRLAQEAARRSLADLKVQAQANPESLELNRKAVEIMAYERTLLDGSAPFTDQLAAGTELLAWLLVQADEEMLDR